MDNCSSTMFPVLSNFCSHLFTISFSINCETFYLNVAEVCAVTSFSEGKGGRERCGNEKGRRKGMERKEEKEGRMSVALGNLAIYNFISRRFYREGNKG